MWIQKKIQLSTVSQCLLKIFQKSRDKGGSVRAILTDFSKAFDCFLHGLLIAKLHGYGFDMASLKLIYTLPAWKEKKSRNK